MTNILPPHFTAIRGWSGECPIILIGGEHYAVYDRQGELFRCFRMTYNAERSHWFHADDDIYWFDKTGKLRRKEV